MVAKTNLIVALETLEQIGVNKNTHPDVVEKLELHIQKRIDHQKQVEANWEKREVTEHIKHICRNPVTFVQYKERMKKKGLGRSEQGFTELFEEALRDGVIEMLPSLPTKAVYYQAKERS